MKTATQNKAKTHCLRGHAFAEHGTKTKDNFRRCRVCDRARKAAERARAKSLAEVKS